MNKFKLFAGLLKGLFIQAPRTLGFAERYLAAWNARDATQIRAMSGCYSDPLSQGVLEAEALRLHLEGLFKAFPDLALSLDGPISVGCDVVAARYRLRGINKGALPGDFGFDEIPPTGRAVDLAGVLFLEFDKGELPPRVSNSFEVYSLAQQLGFLAALVPREIPNHQFGIYYRLNKGNRKPPEAIGMTWIQVRKPEQFLPVAALTHQVAESFSDRPGFVTGIVGARPPDESGWSGGFTLSAWEDLEALNANLLPNAVHQDAVQQFMKQGLAWSTHSRVYQLVRAKPVMIGCLQCGKQNNAHKKEHLCSACGTELPPPPDYW